jgi:hypothetical protein
MTASSRSDHLKPLDVPSILDKLTDQFPSRNVLLEAALDREGAARFYIARLWLSEGIPFAFIPRPAVYESMRRWLARRLALEPKEITVVGSARTGFSLSPDKNLGREFGPHSDLDLAVVSFSFFERLRCAFRRWADDFEASSVKPTNETEATYWRENLNRCPSNLKRGFIDANRIPLLPEYREASEVAQAIYLLRGKLRETDGSPQVRKVSIRCYRDWDSFASQMAMNLMTAARKNASLMRT